MEDTVVEQFAAVAPAAALEQGFAGGVEPLFDREDGQCIAFDDLLSEAVYRLEVENFPAVVAMDCHGGNIYKR